METQHHSVARGYAFSDQKEFSESAIAILQKAGEEIFWLINRDYPIKSVSNFVGNRYLLSERQRLALVRSISPQKMLHLRREKQKTGKLSGETVFIDTFNQIITLEVALSSSTLLRCMDNTIRDLAGLRGTYRLIDKTIPAIHLIGKALEHLEIAKAVFYLDAPVSNSGRLKQTIADTLSEYSFSTETELVDCVDPILMQLPNVITGDAIILDHCKSWINLMDQIFQRELPDVRCMELFPKTVLT